MAKKKKKQRKELTASTGCDQGYNSQMGKFS